MIEVIQDLERYDLCKRELNSLEIRSNILEDKLEFKDSVISYHKSNRRDFKKAASKRKEQLDLRNEQINNLEKQINSVKLQRNISIGVGVLIIGGLIISQ